MLMFDEFHRLLSHHKYIRTFGQRADVYRGIAVVRLGNDTGLTCSRHNSYPLAAGTSRHVQFRCGHDGRYLQTAASLDTVNA